MSDERSYYEIALTNRQVAFAIGTLLLCVIGAFVAGLWVAREAIGDGPAAVTVAQGGNDETFDFFGAQDEGSSPGETLPTTASPSTNASDPEPQEVEMPVQRVRSLPDETVAPREERSEPREAKAGSAGVAVRRKDPKPAPEEKQDPPAREVSVPEPQVRTIETPEPARNPEASSEEVTRSTDVGVADPGGDSVIQVFSSADESQASALLSRLRDAGFSSFMAPLDNGNRTMYRVRVGPYGDRARAEAAAEKLRRDFRLETWITSR